MEKNKVPRVCVTGGSGYIGYCLVKMLLQEGHTVHATLRNLDDASKVGLLKSLPNADTNLLLFRADIYDPNKFEAAIEGTRIQLKHSIAGVRSIADSCTQSQTVRRLIYTASVLSMSRRNDTGVGFRPLLDESCWTPLDASSIYGNEFNLGYIKSKTLAESSTELQ